MKSPSTITWWCPVPSCTPSAARGRVSGAGGRRRCGADTAAVARGAARPRGVQRPRTGGLHVQALDAELGGHGRRQRGAVVGRQPVHTEVRRLGEGGRCNGQRQSQRRGGQRRAGALAQAAGGHAARRGAAAAARRSGEAHGLHGQHHRGGGRKRGKWADATSATAMSHTRARRGCSAYVVRYARTGRFVQSARLSLRRARPAPCGAARVRHELGGGWRGGRRAAGGVEC